MKPIIMPGFLVLTLGAAAPADAGGCGLCNLGAVLNGYNAAQQGLPPPQYVPPPQPYFAPPVQYHNYTFPGGRQLNCSTIGTGILTTTDCY